MSFSMRWREAMLRVINRMEPPTTTVVVGEDTVVPVALHLRGRGHDAGDVEAAGRRLAGTEAEDAAIEAAFAEHAPPCLDVWWVYQLCTAHHGLTGEPCNAELARFHQCARGQLGPFGEYGPPASQQELEERLAARAGL